jgi:hypothetical protein
MVHRTKRRTSARNLAVAWHSFAWEAEIVLERAAGYSRSSVPPFIGRFHVGYEQAAATSIERTLGLRAAVEATNPLPPTLIPKPLTPRKCSSSGYRRPRKH